MTSHKPLCTSEYEQLHTFFLKLDFAIHRYYTNDFVGAQIYWVPFNFIGLFVPLDWIRWLGFLFCFSRFACWVLPRDRVSSFIALLWIYLGLLIFLGWLGSLYLLCIFELGFLYSSPSISNCDLGVYPDCCFSIYICVVSLYICVNCDFVRRCTMGFGFMLIDFGLNC